MRVCGHRRVRASHVLIYYLPTLNIQTQVKSHRTELGCTRTAIVSTCARCLSLLREASAAIRDQAEDQQAHECHEEALALWRQLLRSMAVRERIERQYAHLDDGS